MSYPDPKFLQGYTGDTKGPLMNTVEKENKPGERPGAQHKLDLTPIDDIYANGKPYKGADKLVGKSAWISGGDSGIGRATAILFAIEGAEVAISYLPSEQKDADDVKSYIKQKTGKEIVQLPADLKSEQNTIDVVEKAAKAFGGKIDILVNNAAQQLENHKIETLSSKQWEDAFQLNIHHYFHACKAALKYMPPGGSIINMASINAFIGRPDLLEYTSSKGAIISFNRALSNQIIGDRKIRVNAIAPGPVYTPLPPATFSKENIQGFDGTPMGRPGQPVECATVCVFLAAEDSSFITGQTIHVNGGVPLS